MHVEWLLTLGGCGRSAAKPPEIAHYRVPCRTVKHKPLPVSICKHRVHTLSNSTLRVHSTRLCPSPSVFAKDANMTNRAANDVLRWGVLGASRMVRKMAPFMNSAGHRLEVVSSRDAAKAARMATELSIPASVIGYDAVLTNPNIDAVYIPLPPNQHAEWTVKAAAAGKHVLCEKPLALNLQEANAMASACQQARVVLLDNTMWLFHPRTTAMRAILDTRELGEIGRVTAAVSFPAYNMARPDHRFERALGGGATYDILWYAISACLWAIQKQPTSVWARQELVGEVDEVVSAHLTFGEGQRQVGALDASYQLMTRRWFEVAGSHASLVCDDFTRPFDAAKVRFWTHGGNGKMAEHKCDPVPSEQAVMDTFLALVRDQQNRPAAIAPALATQRVLDNVLAAAK